KPVATPGIAAGTGPSAAHCPHTRYRGRARGSVWRRASAHRVIQPNGIGRTNVWSLERLSTYDTHAYAASGIDGVTSRYMLPPSVTPRSRRIRPMKMDCVAASE